MNDEHLLLLGEIKGTVDASAGRLERIEGMVEDVEGRVRSLEASRTRVMAYAAAIGLLSSLAGSPIGKFFTTKFGG